MRLGRRQFLIGAAAVALCPRPARAADFAIDWQGRPPDPIIAARLDRQIAIVRAAAVRAEIAAFWAAETIHIPTGPGEGSHAAAAVYMTRDPFPDDNPVLLHELIHRWHFSHLANTPRAAELRQAFEAEREHPHWPARAYMYTNLAEYLAMCASVVIYGRAARPPLTRAQVRKKLPATYAFVVKEFGVRL